MTHELVIRVRFEAGIINVGEAMEAIATTVENWTIDTIQPSKVDAPVIALGPIWAGSTIVGGASIIDTERVTR